MKISQLSKSIGVPVPTLRRWTVEFAAGLSPEARGIDGRARVFSARDVRLLRRAKDLLAEEDATYASVRGQLVAEKLLPSHGAAPISGDIAADADERPPEAVAEEERVAAERFVRAIAEPMINQSLQDFRRQYDARLEELELTVAELRAEIARLRREPARSSDSGDRRRWPFG